MSTQQLNCRFRWTALGTAIVFACLAAVASCDGSPARSLDAAAAEYVKLAREQHRSDDGYRRALASLHARVDGTEEDQGRRAFLLAQLAGLERRARFVAGEHVTIRADALALGLAIPEFDGARVTAIRAELDNALPGSGPLTTRLAAHRRNDVIPRVQLDAVATEIVAECRARMAPLDDVRDAGVELRYVLDQPWPAFATYRGNRRSLVELRRDVAWNKEDLRIVLCHETYPGHHVQHLVWADLHETRGWVEFTVMPPFTPQAIMAERAAVTATDLLWPPANRPVLARALSALTPFAAATAVDVADGRLDRAAGLARLRHELLMPNADEFIAFVEQHRSMSLAYITPAPEIHDWQSYLALLRSPEGLVRGASPATQNGTP